MSNVWKKPSISPHSTVVAASDIMSTVPGLADTKAQVSDEQRCQYCQERLAAVVEKNIVAAAKLKASALEQAARQRALSIIDQAQEEVARIKDQAKEEGYRIGYEAGYKTGQAEAEQLKEEAKALVIEAENERAAMLAEVKPQALELAFAVAERILRREVARSPQMVTELLKAGVDKLPEGKKVTVEVAPGMAAAWRDADALVQEAMGDRPYEVVESSHIPPGEFVLSSEAGTVDARLQPQLEVCRQHLLGEDINVIPQTGPDSL